MIESLQPVLTELERAVHWAYSRYGERPADATPVVVTIQHTSKPHWAWISPDSWVTRGGSDLHELNVTPECLLDDPVDIVGHVVHEVVHLINVDCDIKDCSKSGRHNSEFDELAEQLGLVIKGNGITTPGKELARAIVREFKPDVAAFTAAKKAVQKKARQPRKSTAKWTCGCTVVRAAAGIEVHAICGCGNPFQKEA